MTPPGSLGPRRPPACPAARRALSAIWPGSGPWPAGGRPGAAIDQARADQSPSARHAVEGEAALEVRADALVDVVVDVVARRGAADAFVARESGACDHARVEPGRLLASSDLLRPDRVPGLRIRQGVADQMEDPSAMASVAPHGTGRGDRGRPPIRIEECQLAPDPRRRTGQTGPLGVTLDGALQVLQGRRRSGPSLRSTLPRRPAIGSSGRSATGRRRAARRPHHGRRQNRAIRATRTPSFGGWPVGHGLSTKASAPLDALGDDAAPRSAAAPRRVIATAARAPGR